LLELLFERGKFGKGRIRIGLFVTAGAAKRLCVIALAFGPIDTLATLASVATRTALLAFGTVSLLLLALLTLEPLVTLLTILALLAISTVRTLMTRPTRPARLCRFRRRCRRRLSFCKCDGFAIRGGNLSLLRTLWPTWPLWPAFRTASRPPDLNERRLFRWFSLGQRRLSWSIDRYGRFRR
jgi:hypothetical protein